MAARKKPGAGKKAKNGQKATSSGLNKKRPPKTDQTAAKKSVAKRTGAKKSIRREDSTRGWMGFSENVPPYGFPPPPKKLKD